MQGWEVYPQLPLGLQQDTTNSEDGVGISGASLLAAAAALYKDNDAVKTTADVRNIVAGDVGSDSSTIKTGTRNIVAGDVGSDSSVIKTGPMSDAELD